MSVDTEIKQETSPSPEKKVPGKIEEWLLERVKEATIRVERVPLTEVKDWGAITQDGELIEYANIGKDGKPKYFKIEGRNVYSSGREVADYGLPAIVEITDETDPDKAAGTVGLLVDKKTGDVLVQAVAEPMMAEPGEESGAYMVLRVAVQGSYDALRLHKPPLSQDIDPSAYSKFIHINAQRIQGKIRYGITYVDKQTLDLSEKPNFSWFSRTDIDEAIREGMPFNGFFHAAYNLLRTQENKKDAVEKKAIESK